MAAGPALAFAFGPISVEALFASEDLARLNRLCRIADAEPLRDFAEPRAAALLAATEILVTGWGTPRIDGGVLALMPRLRFIAHAAGSIKGWATPEVFARGIRVAGAADANALPVAEFTVAAILAANKQVHALARSYRRERRGLELSVSAPPDIGNFGKTIGIVGASRIGRRVLELLKPFDLRLLLADPFVTAAEATVLGAELMELDDLLGQSDVVSLHAPSLPETRHLLDRRRLGLLRDGVTLINTARGALIDETALLEELVGGRFSAVLDVTDPEVPPPDSPLYDLPNVLLTPHIAGALGGERRRFGRLVVEEIDRFLRGAPLAHEIDPQTLARQA
jgi:phosphoglycerate dehydrogenase-like enzyme